MVRVDAKLAYWVQSHEVHVSQNARRIETRSSEHGMHTSLPVSHRGARVIIDCGLDWLGKSEQFSPQAIVLTPAHPDQAWVCGIAHHAPFMRRNARGRRSNTGGVVER